MAARIPCGEGFAATTNHNPRRTENMLKQISALLVTAALLAGPTVLPSFAQDKMKDKDKMEGQDKMKDKDKMADQDRMADKDKMADQDKKSKKNKKGDKMKDDKMKEKKP
jgi:Ni/Co efflux regulator RcnB